VKMAAIGMSLNDEDPFAHEELFPCSCSAWQAVQ
jgi:hypothetical protein